MIKFFKGEESIKLHANYYNHMIESDFDSQIIFIPEQSMVICNNFKPNEYPVINSTVLCKNEDDLYIKRIALNHIKSFYDNTSSEVKIINVDNLVNQTIIDVHLKTKHINEIFFDNRAQTINIQYDLELNDSGDIYTFICSLNILGLNPNIMKDKLKKWLKNNITIRSIIDEYIHKYNKLYKNCKIDFNFNLPTIFNGSNLSQFKSFIKYVDYDKLLNYKMTTSKTEIEIAINRYNFLKKLNINPKINYRGINIQVSNNKLHCFILGKSIHIDRNNFYLIECFLKMVNSYDDYEMSLESLKLLHS